MKRWGLVLLAAALSAPVFAAIPTSAEGWYTPDYRPQEGVGVVYYREGREIKEGEVIVDGDYNMITIPADLERIIAGDISLRTAYEALKKATENEVMLGELDLRTEKLGQNLHAVFSEGAWTITGTDPFGRPVSYQLKMNGNEMSVEAEDPTLSHRITDESSLKWKADNTAEVLGWSTAYSSTSFWDDLTNNEFDVPVRSALGSQVLYKHFYGVDRASLAPNALNKLQISGWAQATPEAAITAWEALTNSNTSAWRILARKSDGTVAYMPFGNWRPETPPDPIEVDNLTIATNGPSNVATLYDFWEASAASSPADPSFPYADGTGVLKWDKLSTFVDGVSIDKPEDAYTLEVKGASLQDTNGRYFGTPVSGSPVVGWYDLPPAGPSNYFAAVDNSSIATNSSNELCIKGWDDLTRGVIGKSAAGGVISRILNGEGAVAVTENDDTVDFDLDGWDAGGNCQENLVDLLTNATKSASREQHQVLTRFESDGDTALHYVPIDGIIDIPKFELKTDGETVVTNGLGELEVYGFADAGNDTYLSKNPSGDLAWREVDRIGADNASILTNAYGDICVRGYDTAQTGSIPVKTANGLDWLKGSNATNILLAGAGILITENGGGAVTISAAPVSAHSTTALSVVTAVQYTNHVFQCRRRVITFSGSAGPEGEWETVFEATSHQTEHDLMDSQSN